MFCIKKSSDPIVFYKILSDQASLYIKLGFSSWLRKSTSLFFMFIHFLLHAIHWLIQLQRQPKLILTQIHIHILRKRQSSDCKCLLFNKLSLLWTALIQHANLFLKIHLSARASSVWGGFTKQANTYHQSPLAKIRVKRLYIHSIR